MCCTGMFLQKRIRIVWLFEKAAQSLVMCGLIISNLQVGNRIYMFVFLVMKLMHYIIVTLLSLVRAFNILWQLSNWVFF